MQFIVIVGTTGIDGRYVSYDTSLPNDLAAYILRETLEMVQEEEA